MKPGDVHRTKSESAVLHHSGWVRLDDQWDVTALPLVDVEVDDAVVFARLTYADALRAAKVHGAELIHPEHVERLHELARRGAAFEVPAYTGTPRAEKTYEHSLRHDAACLAALAARGWDPSTPLPTANVGKHWVHGAPSGRSWLMGWHVPDVARYGSSRSGPGFVQGRPEPGSRGPHDDGHHDDGTTTMLVRRRRGAQTRASSSTLGSAVGAVESAARAAAVWLAGVLGGGGQQEEQDLGSKDEKRTAMAPWQGPAHGYRCSVAELYRDAVALGSWVPIAEVLAGHYVVQIGDLVISARAGGDPTKGGPGHVERAASAMRGPRVDTIGGNEGNRWALAPLALDGPDVRGIIRVDPHVGARAVALALEELEAGVAERPGAAHHPRIQEYHAGARRGGSPLAGMPGHEGEGVAVLGARAADEVAWCASSASWCGYQAAAVSAGR